MSEKTLKFNNIRLNKKEFHKPKEPIDLMSVNVNQVVLFDKFNHNNKAISILLVTKKVKLLNYYVLILPQMSGYIKYFENGGKSMSFLIKDDEVWEKYNRIWDVIKNKLGNKFHSKPFYEKKLLKS